MTMNFFGKLLAVALISSALTAQAEARSVRTMANNDTPRSSDNVEDDETESTPAIRTKKKSKQANRTTETKPSEGYWFVRIQQLPLLGLAAVSDNGVVDIEMMKVVKRNFHLGPTAVYHFGKQGEKKMQSMNLGVRADLILGDFGNLEDIYISTALMFGRFATSTKQQSYEDPNTTCNFQSKGYHRVGAFAVGKFWTLSESLHVTTGVGAVKSKTSGSSTDKQTGVCPTSVTESDGTTLPWFDFGVGFRI